jgi:L-amino acid N-acyltransferase YncA
VLRIERARADDLGGTTLASVWRVSQTPIIHAGDSPSLLERFAATGEALCVDPAHPSAPTAARTLASLAPDHPTRRRCQLQLHVADGAGRVAAIINPRLRDADGRPVGLLGFFECEPDERLCAALLAAAAGWLREQGCRVVCGPVDFTTWHTYRFVAEGAAVEWMPGEPYHPAYYPSLWRAAGFSVAGTYTSNWMGDPEALVERFAPHAGRAAEHGYTVRTIAADGSDLRALYAVATDAFAGAYLYSPIELDEFAALYTPGRSAAVAGSTYVACAPDGALAGFVYAYVLPSWAGREQVTIIKTIAVTPAHRDRALYQTLLHAAIAGNLSAGSRDFVAALMHVDGSPRLMGWSRPETLIKSYELYERSL